MNSNMPWIGAVSIDVEVPQSVKVVLRLPVADWMANMKVRTQSTVSEYE